MHNMLIMVMRYGLKLALKARSESGSAATPSTILCENRGSSNNSASENFMIGFDVNGR